MSSWSLKYISDYIIKPRIWDSPIHSQDFTEFCHLFCCHHMRILCWHVLKFNSLNILFLSILYIPYRHHLQPKKKGSFYYQKLHHRACSWYANSTIMLKLKTSISACSLIFLNPFHKSFVKLNRSPISPRTQAHDLFISLWIFKRICLLIYLHTYLPLA